MWIKNISTNAYIFVGVKRAGIFEDYVYHTYQTSTGIQEFRLDSFSTGDNWVELTAYYLPGSGTNEILYYANNSYGQSRAATADTGITISVWDILQTGMRINANSGGAYQDLFNTRAHKWRCGSCGNVWVSQTNNGSFIDVGGAANWPQYWGAGQEPDDAGSNGGTYYTRCYSGTCP